MRWTYAILIAALLAGAEVRAEDPRQAVQAVMREALLRQATLPSSPPMLPDRDTVLPSSTPGTRPSPSPPPRETPGREQRGPHTPKPNGMHDGKSAVAAHGARDGSAMREEMRGSMAHAAQSRAMTHGARDANAMRTEADHRAARGIGVGAMSGTTGQHEDGSGSWGHEDGASMWRTMNPHGGTMEDEGKSGGGHAGGGMDLISPTPGAASTRAPGR
jgi:hypothetical protein